MPHDSNSASSHPLHRRNTLSGLALRAFHPLATNSLRHWLRLVRDSGGIDSSKFLEACVTTAVSPLWAPLRISEKLLYWNRVRRTQIHPRPLFILGHWRTGTTMLHNLLAQDPQFGYVSLLQTMMPTSFLSSRPLIPLIARVVPEKRPMDDVALGLEMPQEDEYAMCNFSARSFYIAWYFPLRMRELFIHYALFDHLEPREVDAWRQEYLQVMRAATYACGGKPLVLKNPVNTVRVRHLLRMFPEARFIYLYRNPYEVYRSTVKLHRAVIDMVGLQQISDEEIEENLIWVFKEMWVRYEREKAFISKNRLIEIKYEDLAASPLEVIQDAYEKLGIPGFETAKQNFETHLESHKAYTPDSYQYSLDELIRVETEWDFALEKGGYARPAAR